MIILIPLYRFQVKYEVASGQPYSELHTLILRAVSESSGATLEVLQKIFALPSRLLIEVLITLFKEGWIAISDRTGGGFDITRQGTEALRSNRPPEMRQVDERGAAVFMERFTGMLIPQAEIRRYESRRDLKASGTWERAFHLKPEFDGALLDEGQVQNLLRRDRREWIRYINQPIRSHDTYYLPVDVNLDEMNVTGLPERWRPHLEPLLLDVAAGAEGDGEELTQSRYWGERDPHPIREEELAAASWWTPIPPEDLLVGRERHAAELRKVFDEARSAVLVVSGSDDMSMLSGELRDHVVGALGRNVSVDLLTTNPLAGKHYSSDAADLTKGATAEAGAGLNLIYTDVHANMVIYDTDEGFWGLVGSYNWLAGDDGGSGHLTVRLRHPGVLAELCQSASAFMLASRGIQLSSSPYRWRRIAEGLNQLAIRADPPDASNNSRHDLCSVQVVRDQKHALLLSEFLLSAQASVAVFSQRLDGSAERRLMPLRNRAAKGRPLPRTTVLYGQSPEGTVLPQALTALIEGSGGKFAGIEGLCANALVADTTALVSSYNFLGRNTLSAGKNARDVGVLLEGGVIAQEILKSLAPATTAPSE